MKKITLLFTLLAATFSYGQADGDLQLGNIFHTGLETTNTCDINFGKAMIVENTATITTNSKDVQHFNVSWLFKRYDADKAQFRNKKVPAGSTTAEIMSVSGAGFTIDGLNTTDADGVLSLGTNPCTSVVGAKIMASVKFTGFSDDANLTTATATFTTNPNNGLDAATYKTETFTVIINYDATASVNELKKFNFNFAPNPAKNQLNLSASKNIEKVEVFNLLGKKSLSSRINSLNSRLDISDLASGIYVMQVTIENAIESYKIIKE